MLKEGKLELCFIGGFGVVTQMVLMLALLSGRVIPSPQLAFSVIFYLGFNEPTHQVAIFSFSDLPLPHTDVWAVKTRSY